MNSTATTVVPPAAPVRATGDDTGVTQRRVIRSEWIKLRSVRSMVVGLLGAGVVTVGLGILFSWLAGSGEGPGRREANDPLSLSLAGFNIGRLVIGVLGVLVVTSEYSSGMIRTMFAAVADRLPVLRAKALVFSGSTLAVMAVAAFTAFFVGQAVYGGSAVTVALGDPGVLRAVVGTAVYAAGVGALGVALGFLLRSTGAGIGVLFATLLIIPGLVGLLPASVSDPLTKVMPSNAGEAFTSVARDSSLLSPTAGFLVFALWVVGLLVAASVVVRRRDA